MLPPIEFSLFTTITDRNTNITAALIIAAAFVLGAYLGSKFSDADERVVKRIFGVVMILAAMKLLFENEMRH